LRTGNAGGAELPDIPVVAHVQLVGLGIGRLVSDLAFDKVASSALGSLEAEGPWRNGNASIGSDAAYASSKRYATCSPFTLGGNLAAFAAADGGLSEFGTRHGGEIDLDHLGILAGLGWRGNTGIGQMLLGGYLNGGIGRYDSEFAGRAYAKNDRFHHFGTGLFARYDVGNGMYAEGGGHLGRSIIKFDGISSLGIAFTQRSTHFGLGIGGGYVFDVRTIKLDISARYQWAGAVGKNLAFPGYSPFQMDTAHSHRTRLGAKAVFAAGRVSPYAGAALEYEFQGKSNGQVFGYAVKEASFRGATGIGEIGVRYASGIIQADLSIQGYLGKRRGFSAGLGVGVSF
jgi:hypothetical protein